LKSAYIYGVVTQYKLLKVLADSPDGSDFGFRIEKPAGWSRRLITTEVQMIGNLLLLLLIVVILGFEVKVIVRRR
jgi:hypothetical protein